CNADDNWSRRYAQRAENSLRVMKAQKEKGAEWHKSTRPDVPITSFFVKRMRAQLAANKTLINDAVALVVSLMQ
uniref:Vinculin n=1 Tax=Parascaris univalens TaxID=6257 RepID=A0A914ZIS3_PARUN